MCLTLITIKIDGELDWEKGPFLFLAAQKGLPVVLKALLDNGVNVNYRNEDGQTVLLWLMLNKKVENCQEMFKILLDAGADVCQIDKQGHSPINFAKGQTDPLSQMINAHIKELAKEFPRRTEELKQKLASQGMCVNCKCKV